jgi:hypothetical protein
VGVGTAPDVGERDGTGAGKREADGAGVGPDALATGPASDADGTGAPGCL